MKKGKVANELVPLIEGTKRCLPCIYGDLVEKHSVYCDNSKSLFRKCRFSWYHGRVDSVIDKCADEDCEYFKPNPAYVESKDFLKQIEERKIERKREQKEWDALVAEGWLCLKCWDALPFKGKKVFCNSGTLVTGVVKYKKVKDYSDAEIDKHFTLDPMEIPMRKKCKFFREIPEEGK